MPTIKELAPKPSDALRAMINGLFNQDEREDFRIDMTSFGNIEVNEGREIDYCYGCAATCALQEIAHKNFVDSDIMSSGSRARFLGFDYDELSDFEYAMEEARNGLLLRLFKFYNISMPGLVGEDGMVDITWGDGVLDLKWKGETELYFMSTGNWSKNIPSLEAHIQKLISAGY